MITAVPVAECPTPIDYIQAGWFIVPIRSGSKKPLHNAWNVRENCIAKPEQAKALRGNIGLAHAYSGTCCIDIDSIILTRPWLKERGIDVDKLLNAPDAVLISSGRPDHAKLLYRMPGPPLKSLAFKNAKLEFRCATEHGTTVQDLLPPSIHPDTGKPYRWHYPEPLIGEWKSPPLLPETLHLLWQSLLKSHEQPYYSRVLADLGRLEAALAKRDPDCGYDEWIKIGMALHHESGSLENGFAIWDQWSSRGQKYRGTGDLRKHWNSFSSAPGKTLVTAGSILKKDTSDANDFTECDGRPVVGIDAGQLHIYAAKCEDILSSEIYVRERTLVRIGGALELSPQQTDNIRRDDRQAVIIPASQEYLRRRLNQLARFQAHRRKGNVWIDCPKDLAINIAGQGDWPTLRTLKTIARAPFVRSDGSICETPGYDPPSSVFYAPNDNFPSIPLNPTADDASRALAMLRLPFDQFPFATDAAVSSLLAHILTEIARPAVNLSPAFFYTAPTPGIGKSLLSEISSRIVHGCGPALRPWVESGEELRKGLFSSLLAGDRTIGFDNLPNGTKVRSPILCGFITAETYSDRRLGASDVRAVPNRSVVFLTGNNLTPAGDLARRSIVIRLDANTADLRSRRFRITDLREYVACNRPSLLVAGLTIIRAYLVANAHSVKPPLPSFENWSRFVRDPLLWLGMADPVDTQDDETEDETAPLADAFRLIAQGPGAAGSEFMASDLANLCAMVTTSDPFFVAIGAAGCSDPADHQRVGYWLREKRDRIADGYKLERGREAAGGRKWRLRRLS
jgi:hypothetical protein